MKYKVGDKAKVREDLEYNVFYGGNRVNEDMIMHKGKILTIRAIEGRNYLMEEDNWCWTDEMLEDVKEELLKEADYGIEAINEQNRIEKLEIKLKNKQSEIDFLKGQISAYEKILLDKEV